MRILGIDPGYAIIGWGVLDFDNVHFSVVKYGAITTSPDTTFDKRLDEIYGDMNIVIDKFRPDCMSVEKLYFNSNITTGIDVAQARGVIVLSAAQNGLNISEYTPLQVKQAITGYGRAEKRQVIAMVTAVLNLKKPPKPDDTADALALAICHGHCAASKLGRFFNS